MIDATGVLHLLDPEAQVDYIQSYYLYNAILFIMQAADVSVLPCPVPSDVFKSKLRATIVALPLYSIGTGLLHCAAIIL